MYKSERKKAQNEQRTAKIGVHTEGNRNAETTVGIQIITGIA